MITSWPESLFSLGMDERVYFEIGYDGRLLHEVVIGEALALQVKFQGLFQVGHKFIERFALGDNGEVDAFGYIVLFALVDMNLDDLFHGKNLSHIMK